MTDRDNQIERINEYELMMDEAKELIASGEMGERLAELLDELDEYYHSPLWLMDFEDDEAGMLPDDLKRGVLSEDGLYDLFESLSQNDYND